MATTPTSKLPRVALLEVSTPAGTSGRLSKNGQHSFTYATDALLQSDLRREISLTMPLRAASYERTPMLPVFQTFLPEGFLKERIVEHFGKVVRVDDMALLALSSSNAIGRLRLRNEATVDEQPVQPESLAELLDDQGSRDLFAYLCDKYLIRSGGIAGVQPKVMLSASDANSVMVSDKMSLGDRATLRAQQYIVKVGTDEYPGLAENEHHCLNVAALAGLSVPRQHLSADRKRLVLERFDYVGGSGLYLGFEDMVSLQGSVNDRKYEGSYEGVAQTIARNVTPALRHQSLREFFASVVLSVVLRNGDAHLKNFGLLYTDPGSDDCRLSPLYDIVCTTLYIPKDRLALSLAGSRSWPDGAALAAFGENHCEVGDATQFVEKTIAAVAAYRPAQPSQVWTSIREDVLRASSFLTRG